jgi:hypothetical protein
MRSDEAEANLKCPNHNSTGKGRLKARKRNCHKENTAPTNRLKVIPIKMILSNFHFPPKILGNQLPKKVKKGTPIIKFIQGEISHPKRSMREYQARYHKTESPSKPKVEGLAKIFLEANWIRLPV